VSKAAGNIIRRYPMNLATARSRRWDVIPG